MGQLFRVVMKDDSKTYTAYNRYVDGVYTFGKLTEHAWWFNDFVGSITKLLYHNPMRIAWVGQYGSTEKIVPGENLYELAWNDNRLQIEIANNVLLLDEKYLCNHDRKTYLDCSVYRKISQEDDVWCIHPLPLLTAVGNGNGSGDYNGKNKQDVGTWAWDRISVEDDPPHGYSEASYLFNETQKKEVNYEK